MPLLWNLPLESCSVAWKGEDRVVLWSYCVYLVLKYYVPFKPVSLPWTVKCSLPSFCMVAHFTPSLVLSLVLLSCPLPSLGHCALLRGESKSRTLTDLLFLRSHWKQNQQQEKKKSLVCMITPASVLWWVCFSPAETELYGNSKLKSPTWKLLEVTRTSSGCSQNNPCKTCNHQLVLVRLFSYFFNLTLSQ